MNANGHAGNEKTTATPVRRVLEVFGSARAAAMVNLTTDALRKWDREKAKGGGGGLIPAWHQRTFLEAARADGLPLTAEDLIAEPR